jgi:hypothetical protein
MVRISGSLSLGSLIFSLVAADDKCPVPEEGFSSINADGGKASFTAENLTPFTLEWFWLDFSGNEIFLGIVDPFFVRRDQSYFGHAFRAYSVATDRVPRTLVFEKRLTVGDPESKLKKIKSCGVLADDEREHPRQLDGGKGKLFESLTHNQKAPCEPADDSSKWSCVRFIPKDKYQERLQKNPELFGFLNEEEAAPRAVGETVDTGYVSQIPIMPRVSDGPGFLKMSFSPRLREVLAWFAQAKQTNMTRASIVPGHYTNNHIHRFDEVNLDHFPDIHRLIKVEMRDILQWWTKMLLKHTDTFGVRVYRRESMLINHVDRDNTHLASAVIQVDQMGLDKNGGWPLEVLTEDGDCYEVYLQPGELVLYEGGKFRHGRPMRFRGDGFANLFSHFAPIDWYGAGKSPDFVSVHAQEL